jgi:hypothetical protein
VAQNSPIVFFICKDALIGINVYTAYKIDLEYFRQKVFYINAKTIQSSTWSYLMASRRSAH